MLYDPVMDWIINLAHSMLVSGLITWTGGPVLVADGQDVLLDPPVANKDCYCTNRGKKYQLGEQSCLKVGDRSYTAVCQMVLNNPAWREVVEGCLSKPIS